MKIQHFCPECKLKKEIRGMKANMRAFWAYTFDEDYDFYKSQEEIKTRNSRILEHSRMQKDMMTLMDSMKELEDRLWKHEDFRKLKTLGQKALFIQGRIDYIKTQINL